MLQELLSRFRKRLRTYLLRNARFSKEEIRVAFWRQFHESGEHFFSYFEPEAASRDTEDSWREFEQGLDSWLRVSKND